MGSLWIDNVRYAQVTPVLDIDKLYIRFHGDKSGIKLQQNQMSSTNTFVDKHALINRKTQYQNQWNHQRPFYKHGLTLIPSWISNHMPSKVWDEITFPFSNFNTTDVRELISNFIPHFIRYRKTSNMIHTLVGNKTVDQSDIVGASLVGAAPTTSSFST